MLTSKKVRARIRILFYGKGAADMYSAPPFLFLIFSEEQNGPRKQDMEERAEGNGGNCWQNSDLKYSKASGKPQAVEDIHL